MDMTQEPQPAARDRLYKAILDWHLTPSMDNREALKVAVDAVCGRVEVPQPAAAQPLHITTFVDWLHARFQAAGGKEGITDVSAWAEEVMRWTEAQHGIGSAT